MNDACVQVCELCIYLALGANWAALDSWRSAQPLLVLGAVAAVPVVYSRSIVDFGC